MIVAKFKNSLLIFSLILNVMFIVLVFIYVARNKESLTQKFIWKFNTETLIMFGDSHTARGNWNDLFDRRDVLKVGYSGFTSGQLEFMMKQYIVDRNASYCFVQCGGNDLNKAHFDPKQMNSNINSIIKYLKAEKITPVLQSLFHRPDPNYNITIDSLNMGLWQLAQDHGIDFIDVNPFLDKNNNIGEHIESDKVHLNEQGYKIWAGVVQKYLMEKGID